MTERLLRLVGPLHVIGGLALFLTYFWPAANETVQQWLELPGSQPGSAFFVAIFGPTVASWGVLFGALANAYLAAPSQALWRALLTSILIWAVLDTSLCLLNGLHAASTLNVIVAAGIASVLWLNRRHSR